MHSCSYSLASFFFFSSVRYYPFKLQVLTESFRHQKGNLQHVVVAFPFLLLSFLLRLVIICLIFFFFDLYSEQYELNIIKWFHDQKEEARAVRPVILQRSKFKLIFSFKVTLTQHERIARLTLMLYMEIYERFVVFALQDKFASPGKNYILIKHENSAIIM